MILGIDYLGGVNYIDTIVKHHPKNYAAGFLINVEGWDSGLKAARALAESKQCCSIMRLHGTWHDNHRFTNKDIPQAVKIAKQVLKLAEDYPSIKFFYSPWLEPNCSKDVMKACKKACKEVLGKRVIIVCGERLAKGYSEVHHGSATSGKYVFSFDGLDMFDTKVSTWKAAHRNAQQFYGWIPACNGKKYTDDNTPRWKRKNWLTKAQIDKMVQLLKW